MTPPRMRFHHVGYVVHSIDASVEAWGALGYERRSETYEDPRQGIMICFVSASAADAPTIELVQPSRDDSVVRDLLTRQGAGAYHACFEVERLDDAMTRLDDLGYRAVAEPAPSPAFEGRPFVFLYHRDAGLIELVEQRGGAG